MGWDGIIGEVWFQETRISRFWAFHFLGLQFLGFFGFGFKFSFCEF